MPADRIDRAKLRDAVRARLLARLPAVGRFLVGAIRDRSPDRTGELDASYAFEVDEAGDRVLVGSTLVKSRPIELGTTRMKPRAPIRRTLAEEGAKLPEILTGDGAK